MYNVKPHYFEELVIIEPQHESLDNKINALILTSALNEPINSETGVLTHNFRE